MTGKENDEMLNVKEMTIRLREYISMSRAPMDDAAVKDLIENEVFAKAEDADISISEIRRTVERIFYALRSDLDILQPFVDDIRVSEIMVNGKDHIFVERDGHLESTDVKFDETEELEEVIRRISAKVHREINELSPIVDARLQDGSRVNAVFKNIALGGPILTIRKFPEKAYTMHDLLTFNTLTEECAAFLERLVKSGYNCFISGGTSSGKTTFLNVLSNYIPADERVIVIEDSAELQIRNIENLVRMECKNANGEGKGKIEMERLIKTSLRMRPDRIIVGEVRGPEVMDMINAMNTGHDGSLSTGHGNSVQGMLRRLESMFLQAADYPVEAIRSQIAEGIDIMIHLGRMPDKSRKVLEISELTGITAEGGFTLNPLFKYHPEKGLNATGNKIIKREKLILRGYDDEIIA